MMYTLITITLCTLVACVYNARKTSLMQQQFDDLESNFIHTLESLDYVLAKLEIVRESLKSIRHADEDQDDTDWWKKQ